MAPACGLVTGLASGKVIADRAYDADSLHDVILDEGGDRAYDSNALRQTLAAPGARANVKPMPNRVVP